MSDTPSFAKKLEELEAITNWFESEKVDLNEALTKFERGMELATELKKELGEVENRVEKIKQKFTSNQGSSVDTPSESVEVQADAERAPELF